ncbi:MAG: pH regulation protein F [Treponema sp.]|nr:pH regulation protein F [Treponema sp.]
MIPWDFVLWFFLGSLVLGLARLIIGPSTTDRLVGLNLVAGQVLTLLVLLAVKEDVALYLDVALVYDIFGFLGILAVVKYFTKRRVS